jgi:two-component system phosphate regulon sensor histidine kinase PhoR
MSPHWRKVISVLAPGAALAAVVGLIAGPAVGLGLAAGLFGLMLAHQVYNLSLFRVWLLDPRIDNIPEGSGIWEQLFSRLLRMHKRQAQTEASLHEALTRFQKAGAALPEAVVILDGDNHVEWCNPRAATYFGLDPERDRGQQVTYLLRHPNFVDYLLNGDYASPLTLKLPVANGDAIVSLQIVPYGDHEKLLLGRDVTRWERLETTRRDFVANVSHELRTPLTVLSGFLEILTEMEEDDRDMRQRSLRLMTQQAVRMSQLVEDLLTLSRIESTDASPKEDPVDMEDLLQHLHQDALALSNGRHRIHLHVDTDDTLKGSSDELRSAFGNLVSNAIRYTPEGGEIDVRWRIDGDKPIFSVTDTGIGIESQHIDRLTERFYRVDRSRSRETGGTGLGLAIAKHVLSRHNATLEVASVPGEGSTFSAVFAPEQRLPGVPDPELMIRTGTG